MHDTLCQAWDYVGSLGLYYRPGSSCENGVRPSKEWVKEQLALHSAEIKANKSDSASSAGEKLLAPRNKPWSTSTTAQTSQSAPKDDTFYKLSSSQYRRLTDQVTGFTGNRRTRHKETPPGRLHSGVVSAQGRSGKVRDSIPDKAILSASVRAFKQKSWVPYHPPSSAGASRPSSGRTSSSYSEPSPSRINSASERYVMKGQLICRSPKSSSRSVGGPEAGGYNDMTPSRASSSLSEYHPYDGLTPGVSYLLSGGVEVESVYGDRPDSAVEMALSTCDDEAKDSEQDSDDSDEGYPEPSVDNINIEQVPELSLRPEKLDAVYNPEMRRGDRRKYNFDVDATDRPEYTFEPCLSEGVYDINVDVDCVGGNKAWRSLGSATDEAEAAIMDRLVEMAKLQLKTSEWEDGRREKLRVSKQRQLSRSRTGSRVSSAKIWREKRCCQDCLQLLCSGDCPEKKALSNQRCERCQERECNGQCFRSSYTARSRQDRESSDVIANQNGRDQRKSTNITKLINANVVTSARSKSSRNIISSQGTAVSCKDPRPLSRISVTGDVEQEFESLVLGPCTNSDKSDRPRTACSHDKRRVRGRATSLPHKSYFSQRRLSITKDMRERLRMAAFQGRYTPSNRKQP